MTTVKVTNVSEKATEKALWEFFAFSGEIRSIDLKPIPEEFTQVAYVTFEDAQALDTAILLTGAVIVDRPVQVEAAVGYVPAETSTQLLSPSTNAGEQGGRPSYGLPTPAPPKDPESTAERAQHMVADLLARGYILGKDSMERAKEYDEKHEVSKTTSQKVAELGEKASATALDLDRRMGLSQKILDADRKMGITTNVAAGAALLNERMTAVDEQYQVSDKTRSAFAVAEDKLNEAGAAIMRNKYVQSGADWLTGAFNRMAKVAGDVGQEASKKVQETEAARGPPAGDALENGSPAGAPPAHSAPPAGESEGVAATEPSRAGPAPGQLDTPDVPAPHEPKFTLEENAPAVLEHVHEPEAPKAAEAPVNLL